MPDEFLTLLDEYTQLGANYCTNVKKLAPDTDYHKLLSIYESGLNGCLSGISTALTQQYSGLTNEEKASLNQTVQLSGALAMLKTANEKIGAHSVSGIIVAKLALNILIKIERLLLKLYPQAGGVLTLFGFKDTIIQNIRDVLSAMSTSEPPPPQEVPPPPPAPPPPPQPLPPQQPPQTPPVPGR
jgi:hypothetical protein